MSNHKSSPIVETRKETWYPFRNLDNYKSTQAKAARDKDVYGALMAAKTLTAARRVVYGR